MLRTASPGVPLLIGFEYGLGDREFAASTSTTQHDDSLSTRFGSFESLQVCEGYIADVNVAASGSVQWRVASEIFFDQCAIQELCSFRKVANTLDIVFGRLRIVSEGKPNKHCKEDNLPQRPKNAQAAVAFDEIDIPRWPLHVLTFLCKVLGRDIFIQIVCILAFLLALLDGTFIPVFLRYSDRS